MCGLSLSIEVNYQAQNICELGTLSVKEFSITPSKDNDISLNDVALFGALSVAKHTAIQAAKITQKDAQNIAFLQAQLKTDAKRLHDIVLKTKYTQQKTELEEKKQQEIHEAIDQNMIAARKQLLKVYQTHHKEVNNNEHA